MGDVDAVADASRECSLMNTLLAERLLETGVLQFGYFRSGASFAPLRFCPEYFPAHPALLSQVAELTLAEIGNANVDRLISDSESLAIGIAASLLSGVSLVYSRSQHETPVYDLVGAFNSGHTCALIVNSILDNKYIQRLERLVRSSQIVGLQTVMIVPLLAPNAILSHINNIPVIPLLHLSDVAEHLHHTQRLPEGQVRAVQKWIDETAASLHPNSG